MCAQAQHMVFPYIQYNANLQSASQTQTPPPPSHCSNTRSHAIPLRNFSMHLSHTRLVSMSVVNSPDWCKATHYNASNKRCFLDLLPSTWSSSFTTSIYIFGSTVHQSQHQKSHTFEPINFGILQWKSFALKCGIRRTTSSSSTFEYFDCVIKRSSCY